MYDKKLEVPHMKMFLEEKIPLIHNVWKSEKKYHSILGAKRATFTFWGAKIVHMGECWSLWSNSVTRQVNCYRTIIGGKCKLWKIQMRHLEWFSNTVYSVDFDLDFKAFSTFHKFRWNQDFHLRFEWKLQSTWIGP